MLVRFKQRTAVIQEKATTRRKKGMAMSRHAGFKESAISELSTTRSRKPFHRSMTEGLLQKAKRKLFSGGSQSQENSHLAGFLAEKEAGGVDGKNHAAE